MNQLLLLHEEQFTAFKSDLREPYVHVSSYTPESYPCVMVWHMEEHPNNYTRYLTFEFVYPSSFAA